MPIPSKVPSTSMESPSPVAPILVVEDEPLIAFDIEDALMVLGAPIRLARSLAEAREVLAGISPPCLVLLDVVLPDGRSFELAEELIGAAVPVAFLTGYDHGIPQAFKDVAVMEKPFSAEALVALARRVIAGGA